MIIVSQDKKEIINFNGVFSLGILTGKTKQVINADGHRLAEYKTEERAKEVLQEIVRIYSKIGIEFDTYNGGKIQQLPIFEMPEV